MRERVVAGWQRLGNRQVGLWPLPHGRGSERCPNDGTRHHSSLKGGKPLAIEPLQSSSVRTSCDKPQTFNIASYLPRMAQALPDQPAVIVPLRRGWRRLTFAELESRSNRCANGLEGVGITRGDRVIVMVKPGLNFFALIFALFKMGTVPVMIDPGMGMMRMVECIATVKPHAFIGIPLAQLMRLIHRRKLNTLKAIVTVGGPKLWGGHSFERLCRHASDTYAIPLTRSDDPAAILFTTGSTGLPKGVEYEHGMFHAQVQAISSHYAIEPGEVDLPAFPLFALFSTAMGMTCVIPDLDPSRPARVQPKKIVDAIHTHNVTNTFGSPAIWRKVGRYCVQGGIHLPSIRRVLMAGAPVSWRIIADMRQVLSKDADVHTPYGATESLPVASISGRELFEGGLTDRARRGQGTCVGKPVAQTRVRLITITDDVIEKWRDELLVDDGQHGEIIVSGPVVTKRYFNQAEATSLHKIQDGDTIWHRIGDIGYRDAEGRIWFCGRKSHRVMTDAGTLYSIECEAIFNEHPDVARSALVGVAPDGAATSPTVPALPVIIIEPEPGRFPRGKGNHIFAKALEKLGSSNPRTQSIHHFLFHRSFPVDIRHNAKIFREKLAVWAAQRQASFWMPKP